MLGPPLIGVREEQRLAVPVHTEPLDELLSVVGHQPLDERFGEGRADVREARRIHADHGDEVQQVTAPSTSTCSRMSFLTVR